MNTLAAIAAVVRRTAAAIARVVESLVVAVLKVYGPLLTFRDAADMRRTEDMRDRFEAAREVAVIVERAEQTVQNLVGAQHDAVMRIQGIEPQRQARPTGTLATAALGTARAQQERPRKVDATEEWMRPIWDWVREVEAGRSAAQAQRVLEQRVREQADADLRLAANEGTRQHAQRNRLVVLGYRRVIHPERSAEGTCGLCMAASTRMYYVNELMPMHGNCKCTTLEVYDRDVMDAGEWLNNYDLEMLYGEAGGNTAAALKRTRYKVEEHSELGPRFVPQDRKALKFTSDTEQEQTDGERASRLAG